MKKIRSDQSVNAEHDGGPRYRIDDWWQVVPAMIHSVNAEGRFVAANDYWLAKLGYSRAEIIGRHVSELMTPDTQILSSEFVFPQLLKAGHIEDVQYQIICKNGKVLDVLLSAVVVDDAIEDRRVTISVLTDVTDLKRSNLKIAENEKLYRGLVESQTELVSLAHPDGRLFFANAAYTAQYGLSQREMIGRNLLDFVPSESRKDVEIQLDRVKLSREMIKSENQIIRPDGTRRWFSWTNLAIANESGQIIAIHSVGRDIEQRMLADTRVKESEARYRMLADHSTDMVFQLDRNRVRRYVSPACKEILGYEPDDLIGQSPDSLIHPDDAARVAGVFKEMLDGKAERHSVENRLRHSSGHWIWVEAHFRLVRDPATTEAVGIIGSLRDISFRKAVEHQLADANRRLAEQALRDGLTGLDNRRAFNILFDREFRRAQREAQPLSVLMIDVDWFKSFNDHYGHPEGDICLQRVAETIGASLQRPGDIAARYGGEEFVVLLPNTVEAQGCSTLSTEREIVAFRVM